MLVAQLLPDTTRSGDTERVVRWLCQGLRERGHDVIELSSPVDLTDLEQFDLVHVHADKLVSPLAAEWRAPIVYTLHGRLDRPQAGIRSGGIGRPAMVSISEAQRRPLEGLPMRWVATIPDPVDVDDFTPVTTAGAYLAYVGGSGEGAEQAVELAEVTGVPLRAAASLDPSEEPHWPEVASLFRSSQVEYVGRVAGPHLAEFLGGALATVFPTDRSDPSPRTVLESLACGTPAITATAGVAAEVVEEGVSGFLCDDLDGMIRAVDEVGWLDRNQCRRQAARFSPRATVKRYEKVYETILAATPVSRSGLTTAV